MVRGVGEQVARLTVFSKVLILILVMCLLGGGYYLYTIFNQKPYINNMNLVTSMLFNTVSKNQIKKNITWLRDHHDVSASFYVSFNVSKWLGVLPKYVRSTSSTFSVQSVRSSTFLFGEPAKQISMIQYTTYQMKDGKTESATKKIDWLEVQRNGKWQTEYFSAI